MPGLETAMPACPKTSTATRATCTNGQTGSMRGLVAAIALALLALLAGYVQVSLAAPIAQPAHFK
jgi:hypothetical protein